MIRCVECDRELTDFPGIDGAALCGPCAKEVFGPAMIERRTESLTLEQWGGLEPKEKNDADQP